MLIWVVGDAAQAADQLKDEVIKEDIAKVLNDFLGRTDIPPPDFLYRNCWTKDKYSYGAYSAASMTMNDNTFKDLIEPLPNQASPKLLFAGEATHPRFWSFLHGARDSGIREADRILKLIK